MVAGRVRLLPGALRSTKLGEIMKTRIVALTSASFVLAGVAVVATADETSGHREARAVKSQPYLEVAKDIKFPTPKPTRKPAPKKTRKAPHTDRSGARKTVTPVAPKPVRKPAQKAAGVTISNYAWCPSNYQSCIDRKMLTGYNGNYLAGHNWAGWQWLSRVAVGTTVRVTSGPLAGTYRVYGHLRLTRQGGSFPNTGGADLVLQSCEGSGTGFSLARRI
jgi:hypothetical protein